MAFGNINSQQYDENKSSNSMNRVGCIMTPGHAHDDKDLPH